MATLRTKTTTANKALTQRKANALHVSAAPKSAVARRNRRTVSV